MIYGRQVARRKLGVLPCGKKFCEQLRVPVNNFVLDFIGKLAHFVQSRVPLK
jgi:hypothetical protein